MRIKVKNILCPICHRRTYFTGKVVYESKRTQVIEWKCADCGVILKSKHDKLGKKYNQIRKREGLSARPVLWIRKGNYRDLLYFEIDKKLYAFRLIDIERLEKDEILAVPVYQIVSEKT
jgi:CRISPR/Cas system-associated protein Cas5 (RAMP superfamily)